MLKDRYGNAVSTASPTALAHYDEALLLMRLYRGDPIAALDKALEEDPGFTAAWAARAAILVQQTDRAYLGEVRRSLDMAGSGGNDRERDLLRAAAAWADGSINRGVAAFTRIARDNPRDLVALQSAHVGHFFLGRASDLRDTPVQALRAFSEGDDGYHAVLGMAAFGMEECGDYDRARVMGEEATRREPRDAWAVHAVAHVHEMRGDVDDGMGWLLANGEALSPDNGFAYHNWWHLALLHLDRNEHQAALALYDDRVRPVADADVVLEWIDASALLWRLHLDGVDVGDRFAGLARCWERTLEDRHYAFNDVHAVMAYIGAGRMDLARRSVAALTQASEGHDDNAVVARQVGLPIATAFLAFAEERYREAAETLLAVRGVAHQFGGSHAQRDILSLTALHAAQRARMHAAAQAIAAERVGRKPASPWARRLERACAD
ncbi:tetratricopeptide repeat protein 38 family protein [Sphingomonas sp. DBB INV C78]|uniref:tetratricopeptide repeat protein n=1 Tax=Sphingomonas sp. DBB INV C78 TaxID=3349434 RepID=UPI0036D3BACE